MMVVLTNKEMRYLMVGVFDRPPLVFIFESVSYLAAQFALTRQQREKEQCLYPKSYNLYR